MKRPRAAPYWVGLLPCLSSHCRGGHLIISLPRDTLKPSRLHIKTALAAAAAGSALVHALLLTARVYMPPFPERRALDWLHPVPFLRRPQEQKAHDFGPAHRSSEPMVPASRGRARPTKSFADFMRLPPPPLSRCRASFLIAFSLGRTR